VVADGKRIIAFPPPTRGTNSGNLQLTFVFNFFDELKRKLP
jgi:hypothetical protein